MQMLVGRTGTMRWVDGWPIWLRWLAVVPAAVLGGAVGLLGGFAFQWLLHLLPGGPPLWWALALAFACSSWAAIAWAEYVGPPTQAIRIGRVVGAVLVVWFVLAGGGALVGHQWTSAFASVAGLVGAYLRGFARSR